MRPHYTRVLEGKHNRFWVKGPESTIRHTEFALHSPGIGGHPGELTAFLQRKHTLPGSRGGWEEVCILEPGTAELGSYLPLEGTLAAVPLMFAL